MKQIAQQIREKGGRAFLVGGIVRDTLMGLPNKDIDIEVYGLTEPQLLEVLREFGEPNLVGQSFGIYKLGDMDISIPRRERKIGVGHTQFAISADPFMSFEEACSRRDLTINAILMCPLSGEIIDPFNGVKDIQKKLIRYVNRDTFAEDPLRVLRVAQFASRFEFGIDPETTKLCRELIPELPSLSRERILGEFEKILLKGKKPSIAFEWMEENGILEVIFPSYDYRFIDNVESRELDVMFALLGGTNGLSNETKLLESVKSLLIPYEFNLTRPSVRQLANKVDVPKLIKFYKAKGYETEGLRSIYEEVKNSLAPVVNGDDLISIGVTPSPHMGRLLKELLNRQFDEEFSTKEQGLKIALDIME